MIVKVPPQGEQSSISISNTRLSSRTQLTGAGAAGGGPSAWSAEGVLALTGTFGTISDESNLVFAAAYFMAGGLPPTFDAVVTRGTDVDVDDGWGVIEQIWEDLDVTSQVPLPWALNNPALIAGGTARHAAGRESRRGDGALSAIGPCAREETEEDSIVRLASAAEALLGRPASLRRLFELREEIARGRTPVFHPMHDDALDPRVEDATREWVHVADAAASVVIRELQERIRRVRRLSGG
jgi:hypothetical protein